MELEGLESILSGEPEAPIVEPKSDLHETSPIVDRARDDHGRFASKEKGELPSGEEPPVVVPPTTTQESDHVPRTALLDERRKRQELEQRIQQMEQQYQNRPAEPEQPSDFWEDPNTFLESRFNQFGQTLLQQWEARQAQTAADRAEAAAKAKYSDYDDAFAKFREQVSINPALVQELQRAADPAEFAYSRGKQALELASVGDLDAYKAKIRAEIEAELRAQSPISPTLPTTTAGQRSVGERNGPGWSGPQPLSSILG
jgi:vacuolar-type H+-ATPase subunit I/STV1